MTRSRIPYLSIAGFIGACALLVAVGGLFYAQILASRDAEARVVKTLLIRTQIRSLQVLLDDAETGQRGFLITGDRSYLEPYRDATGRLPKQMELLEQATQDDPLQGDSLAQLGQLTAEKVREMGETIRARQTLGADAAARIVESNNGQKIMDRLRTILSAMRKEEVRRYHEREELSARDSHRSAVLALGGLSFALVLVLGSGLLLTRKYRELERVEDALQHSEGRFRQLVEWVQDYAIIALDPAGRVASWNRGAERIKGYQAEEIIGQHISRFYTQSDQEAGKPGELLRTAASAGQVTDEGWRVRKDGSKYWASVLITALRDSQGGLTGFSKITRDLTDRKQALEALRASEHKFRAVAETANDAIVSADQEGNIVYWNHGAENAFGYSVSEARGEPATLLIPESLHADFQRGLRHILRTPDAGLFGGKLQTVGRKKDGTEFPLELSLARWESEEGVFFTAIMSDITERLRKERALRESEESLRELSSLLFNVQDEERRRLSRELHDNAGQYLITLKMRLDALETSPGLENGARQRLQECVQLADETIREVRTQSYEMYPPMLEEVGLKSAIPWYLDGFSERSGITATLDIPKDFSRPTRDVELALFRVLQESLTNVRRHSGSQSAHVRVLNHGDTLRLEISDQGKGIPPEVLEAFNREHLGKLGIGLRGMKERIRQLGGKMEVSSNGQGTVVGATVPLVALDLSRFQRKSSNSRW